ncbi:MAG: YhcN/YlaJ family sporulation lipoprotein [Clostridia bacterium]|nr:YhcN/YlaJ family sporulation lipoprotein [Clostridia bacterium]
MKMRNRKDILRILFICLTVALLMTACMNSAGDGKNDRLPAETLPTARPAPQPTDKAEVTQTQNYDWTSNAPAIEKKLARLSEINEARVIVNGSTALVAVKFAPAYQGEMTSRIREMVAGEIMAADPAIKTVAVTAEEEDVNRVYTLSDRSRAGEAIENLKKDIEEIIRNVTTLT